MGFFGNTGNDHLVRRELASIVRIISSDHVIESDLDLYVTAINNISSVNGWVIHGGTLLNVPFFVEPIKGVQIRVALFNELHDNASSDLSMALVQQYEDEIALFLKESHDMLNNKQIRGYFAAIVTESRLSETCRFYPKEDRFEYFYKAEPNGRSFRIIGEILAG